MHVTVAESVNKQIAEEARFWRSNASSEVGERLARDIRAVINTFATGLPGNRVEGLTANFKRVRASKRPPFYLYYYVDEQLEEVFVFLLRHASQRPLSAEEIRQMAEQTRAEIAEDDGEGGHQP